MRSAVLDAGVKAGVVAARLIFFLSPIARVSRGVVADTGLLPFMQAAMWSISSCWSTGSAKPDDIVDVDSTLEFREWARGETGETSTTVGLADERRAMWA